MTNTAILLSSASRQIQRCFSVASSAAETKLLPTRHSRVAPPPACLSSVQLDEVTQEVLETSPGLLIPYKTSARDDSAHAWQEADHSVQKVEWLIRGFSAQINNTIMNKLYSVESDEDPAQCIVKMQSLVRKMEKEGKLYMEYREKMRSQLAVEASRQQDDYLDDQFDDSAMLTFASPGQTIAMFDILLDSMAVSTDPDTPAQVGGIFRKVNERFEQDGGVSLAVNPNTVPTQLTYNAGLRAIANSPNTSEKTRDDAIIHAFSAFDGLEDLTHLKRNSATYAYIIQTIAKFIPPSEMAGNVAHAMWMFAKEDQVVDINVMKALEMVDAGDYPKYQTFLQDVIRDKTIHNIPHSWRKLGKSLRYNSSDDTY